MHFHRSSASRSRSNKLPGLLLILSCLTGAILAQTFQYSRGWTNGRKRAGPVPPMLIPSSVSAAGLLQNAEDTAVISNPCSQLQRIRFLLGARNPQQFYFPCDSWRDISEMPSEDVSERFRRKAPQDVATLSAEGNNSVEN
ncbi:pro-corazonin [Periplaneta americana]|uniref:pro-corazonin n=1 Tax=Periplaneta americana TaxID=6978 RepID=UPI0037E8946F